MNQLDNTNIRLSLLAAAAISTGTLVVIAGCTNKPEASTAPTTAGSPQTATATAPAHGTMTAGARGKKHAP